jgi:hypothetical protein
VTQKRSLQAQYEFLALPALQGGIASLQDWERQSIAMLYVKEVRKGSFRPSGGHDAAHVRAFLEHVMSQMADDDDLKLVLDFQPRLLAAALDLSQRPHPIESVILYATWCEHWLNATLISAGLGKGLSEDDVVQMVRESVRVKLGWLWRTMDLPPMPAQLSAPILSLADVRNEHVHYKWKGHDPDVLTAETSRLKLAIVDIRAIVESLIDFEIQEIVGAQIKVADRLFATSIGPHWRSLALTRPESAPRLIEEGATQLVDDAK